ncbi:transposase family protein [Pseudonocardia sp. ICBG601]|uniref:transposase family protein n=1 Tax=Pseudonocardia sp. ICBG601 TaxID=2846759 RepID=UPI001CF66400|nr:transposase family protein [Pseudonocardia sp. ICBG601]
MSAPTPHVTAAQDPPITTLPGPCLEGQLSWISDPTPGSRHDLHCLDQSGALDHLATQGPGKVVMGGS